MSRLRLAPFVLALLIAAAATGIAACGEDTDEKNDYVGEVNDVTTTLNEELSKVSSSVTSVQSPEEAAAAFGQLASSVQTAADEIEQIDPPEDVAELHDRLVSEVETLAAEATNVVDEIREGGPAAVVGVATRFIAEANRISGEVDATIAEINSALQD